MIAIHLFVAVTAVAFPDFVGECGDALAIVEVQPAETRGGLLDPLGKRMVEHGVSLVNAKLDRLAPKVARAVADTIEADAKQHPMKAADAFVGQFDEYAYESRIAALEADVARLKVELERARCRCCDEPAKPLQPIAEPKTDAKPAPRFAASYPPGTVVELVDGIWTAVTDRQPKAYTLPEQPARCIGGRCKLR